MKMVALLAIGWRRIPRSAGPAPIWPRATLSATPASITLPGAMSGTAIGRGQYRRREATVPDLLSQSIRLRSVADTVLAVAAGGSTVGDVSDAEIMDIALERMNAQIVALEGVGARLQAPVEVKKRTGLEVGDEWFCLSCGRPVEAKEFVNKQPVCPMHRRLLLKLDTSGIKRGAATK